MDESQQQTPDEPTSATPTTRKRGGYNTALRNVQRTAEPVVVRTAPIPHVQEEEESSMQATSPVTQEETHTVATQAKPLPEAHPEAQVEAKQQPEAVEPPQTNTVKTEQPEKVILEKGEKVDKNGDIQKTIYFDAAQWTRLRKFRRDIEDQTDDIINLQDMVRYLVETATLESFANFPAYVEETKHRDRRRKNSKEG